ncbi:MAG: IS1380 family transposase, partial [Opitutaceae bacterium]
MAGTLVLDWDSTVQTKSGHQEDACVGYNPTKPGRKSFHPLLAIAAGTRLCASYHFRPGDMVTATGWIEAMAQ